jgi:hypothetical protein
LRNDTLGYAAHTAVATALAALGCSPEAAGLQWLKAAAHAQSNEEITRVAAGLAGERQRSESAETFDTALCVYVAAGFASRQQAEAVTAAGMRCATLSGSTY